MSTPTQNCVMGRLELRRILPEFVCGKLMVYKLKIGLGILHVETFGKLG